MITCPFSNFIGNHCMPDPVEPASLSRQIANFSEEASFFIAMYRHHSVKPVPDPALILVLNKQWLEKKKRRVCKKEGVVKLWLSKKPHHAVQAERDEFDEL